VTKTVSMRNYSIYICYVMYMLLNIPYLAIVFQTN